MPLTMLTGGAYTARSLTAGAQRCVNLYTEGTWGALGPAPAPTDEPITYIHYCTPGLTQKATAPQAICRGLYTAYNGDLYACYGQQVLHLDSDHQWTLLGTLGPPSDPSDSTQRTTPVSMSDNTNLLLVADGSVDGWYVDLTLPLADRVLRKIDRNINPGWLGADTITYQDTFFIMNDPTKNSAIFYSSLSNITADNLNFEFSVNTAVLVDAGSQYTNGDVLTLTGTGGGQIIVNAVDAHGSIVAATGYGVTAPGTLNVQPANPVAVTGGTGSGATFVLTYKTNVGGFDPLDFAAMTAQADDLQAVVSVYRDLWVVGNNAFEVWTNTGGSGALSTGVPTQTFPFTLYQQGYGDWGTIAKYSVKGMLNKIFWLHRDKFGIGMVMMGSGFSAQRISTHAIEHQISLYANIEDAIGMCYSEQGHLFYLLSFPSAFNDRGATWCFDVTVQQWHERVWIDDNGNEYRHLANAISAAYNDVYVGDWRNENLYVFDIDNYTDAGQPIKRVRGFPHQIDLEANRRVMYHQLIAQIQTGSLSTNGPPVTFIDMNFVAPNNTLLQDYSNINALGREVTRVDPLNGVIVNDALLAQSSGVMLYMMDALPPVADYTVEFIMQPDKYTEVAPSGDNMFVIGRGVNEMGYLAAIVSSGTQYNAQLTVIDKGDYWMPLGTLTAGGYQVTLTMQGTGISMSVYRITDGMWMTPLGWQGNFGNVFEIQDSTYTAKGAIYIGGSWDVGEQFILITGVATQSATGNIIGSSDPAVHITGVVAGPVIGAVVADADPLVPILGVTSRSDVTALSGTGAQTVLLTGVASVPATGITVGGGSKAVALTGVATTSGIGVTSQSKSKAVTLSGVSSTTAVNAPFLSGVGPAVSGSFINIDFTNLAAFNQTVSQYVWGVSTGNLGNDGFAMCADTSFTNIAGSLNFPLYRFNANCGYMEQAYGSGTSISQGTFNAVFGNLINNAPLFMPSNARIVLGLGNYPPSNWSSPSAYGAACANLCGYLLSTNSTATGHPLPIYGFEVGNEQDGNAAALYPYYNAAAVAIHGVSSNFHMCGPTFSWGYDLTNFASTCGSNTQVLDFHYYSYLGTGSYPGDAGILADAAAFGSAILVNARADYSTGGGSATTPFLIGEYNQNGTFGTGGGNVSMTNGLGATYNAELIMSGLNADKFFTMAAIWEVAPPDSDYSLIGGADVSGGDSHVSPGGYLISKAASTMYGPRAAYSSPAGLNGLAVIGGPGTGHFGVMFTNVTTSAISGSVALSHWPVNGTGNGTINKWVSPANGSAYTSPPAVTSLTVTGGLTASVTVPARSVMILYV